MGWDLKIKNFNIIGVHWKIWFFFFGGGGGHEKTNTEDGLPKKGGWDSLQI